MKMKMNERSIITFLFSYVTLLLFYEIHKHKVLTVTVI